LYDVVNFPLTTFVRYDTSIKKTLFGDGIANKIFALANDYTTKEMFDVYTGVTDLSKQNENYQAITMGILKPSDQKLGKLAKVYYKKKPETIIDSLQRPVPT
jgi:hypothetical protein